MERDAVVREHMNITGDVQGVGFRYRAKHAANYLGVTGWVRNEWDGSVTLEVQGTKRQMDDMLSMICRGSYIHIRDIRHKELPLDETERDFHVRH